MLQELYFITAGTLQLTLSFNSDGDSRLSLPGQAADAGTVKRVFSYGPGMSACVRNITVVCK